MLDNCSGFSLEQHALLLMSSRLSNSPPAWGAEPMPGTLLDLYSEGVLWVRQSCQIVSGLHMGVAAWQLT